MTPLTLALAAVLQATSPSAPPAAPAVATPDGDKIVCRRIADTGSRVGGTRECLTKAQWAERQRADAQILRDSQTRGFQLRPQD